MAISSSSGGRKPRIDEPPAKYKWARVSLNEERGDEHD
jgi:hypothetical protein